MSFPVACSSKSDWGSEFTYRFGIKPEQEREFLDYIQDIKGVFSQDWKLQFAGSIPNVLIYDLTVRVTDRPILKLMGIENET